jgi:hypothetical protein
LARKPTVLNRVVNSYVARFAYAVAVMNIRAATQTVVGR